MKWQRQRTLFDAVTQVGVTDAAAAAKLAKTKAMRRFSWVRYPHDLPDKPLWRRVARMAGAPLERVEAMIARLEVHASANSPRGFVEDVDLAALAAHWNLPSDEAVARIYAALEEVGWIDQGYVASFWDRNPDEEGELAERQREGARTRQQRRRARLKAEKEAARQALAPGVRARPFGGADASYPLSRDVTRDSVTVTPRADLNIQQNAGVTVDNRTAAGAESEEAIQGKIASSGDNSPRPSRTMLDSGRDLASPELWLAIEGKRIVVEHLNVQPLQAEMQIERWKRELAGNAAALHVIIRGAAGAGYTGLRFRSEVETAIARRPTEGQRMLPLPAPLKSKQGDVA